MTTEAQRASLLISIEAALARCLGQQSTLAPALMDAMRYAALSGGKRIRPLLTCATAMQYGADLTRCLAPACAVELLHAYSLIHDDLPAMDDDDLRRGKPTVHVVYGDAVAILAGDALQALAFETLARAPQLAAQTRLAMIERLSHAAGWQGMVGGQAFDVAATGARISVDALESMHRAKTGALLRAAIDLGALCAEVDEARRAHLQEFGDAIGLAFQVVDDLLDATQTTATIGKRAGADQAAGKNTFPALLGVEASRARAAQLLHSAECALAAAGATGGLLTTIARDIVQRTT
jgi:geranylgeranyl pyrophosphate synthase